MVAIILYVPDRTIDVPLRQGGGQTETVQPSRDGVPVTMGQPLGEVLALLHERRRHLSDNAPARPSDLIAAGWVSESSRIVPL